MATSAGVISLVAICWDLCRWKMHLGRLHKGSKGVEGVWTGEGGEVKVEEGERIE